jgi:hypothetical protein
MSHGRDQATEVNSKNEIIHNLHNDLRPPGLRTSRLSKRTLCRNVLISRTYLPLRALPSSRLVLGYFEEYLPFLPPPLPPTLPFHLCLVLAIDRVDH